MADTPLEKQNGKSTTVVGKTFVTDVFTIPGVGAAAAYADLDAFGVAFPITVPASGVIQSAVYYDLDDEGLQVDLWFLSDKPTTQTDNAALTFNDREVQTVHGRVQFTTFADATNNQFSNLNNIGLAYVQPNRVMWVQAQTRGALNIALGSEPRFKIVILADE